MEKWECLVCGYVLDEENGDSENAVPSGTYFVDLPEEWECPVCGAPKGQFERIS